MDRNAYTGGVPDAGGGDGVSDSVGLMLIAATRYIVLVEDAKMVDAYVWCRETFGRAGKPQSTWRYDGYAVDNHRRVVFAFREELQAFEFRIRWG